MILPSHRSVAPIYLTGFFWVSLFITTAVTVGINIGIDYGMNKGKSVPMPVIKFATVIEVAIFCEIVGLCVFFGSGSIHQRIKDGLAQPVARPALSDTLFKRIFCFGIAEPRWKHRLPKFMIQVLLFPALPITVLCWMFCWMARDFKSGDCMGSLWSFVGWTAMWKAVAAAVLYTINFAAAHNDEAPELLVAGSEAGPLATGERVDYGHHYETAGVKSASHV